MVHGAEGKSWIFLDMSTHQSLRFSIYHLHVVRVLVSTHCDDIEYLIYSPWTLLVDTIRVTSEIRTFK